MKRSKGFTLIELLVTVSIIALLIALLLPSLGRSRDHARRALCLSHMKMIGTAFYSYGGNNDGMVPDGGVLSFHYDPKVGGVIVDTPNGTNNWQCSWPEELYADGDVMEKYATQGGTTVSYSSAWAHGKGIFYCPSAYTNNPAAVGNQKEGSNHPAAGYGMAYYSGSIWYQSWNQNVTPPIPAEGYSGSSGFARPYTMRTQMWRPHGIVVVEGDINFNRAIGAGGADSTGRYGVYETRHMKGANYLLGDGHAEWNQIWNECDNPGAATPPSKTWTRYPESNWSDVNGGQPKDSSVWGHNPAGKNGNANR